jgi:hypothetical protein
MNLVAAEPSYPEGPVQLLGVTNEPNGRSLPSCIGWQPRVVAASEQCVTASQGARHHAGFHIDQVHAYPNSATIRAWSL